MFQLITLCCACAAALAAPVVYGGLGVPAYAAHGIAAPAYASYAAPVIAKHVGITRRRRPRKSF